MCAHFLKFEKPEVTTLLAPTFSGKGCLIHVRLQVSGSQSVLYMKPEEQPNALPTGTVFRKRSVGGICPDAELTVAPDFERRTLFLCLLQNVLSMQFARVSRCSVTTRAGRKVSVAELTAKPESFLGALPQLWHSLPSA